ncbi:MAG: metal-dependent transcriptional regulator [Anaerolineaceae bacterium]|nr:metal-dependent transcriptional regulator [Anaerolineaceae bacterium]
MSASEAMQDYLAEAYRLAYYQDDNRYVSTSALAEVLHVSPPAVTRMVQRLKEAGFLEHEPYRGIMLTPAGEREALMSIRRHRLVERFLVDVMQFGWHEVHDEADELGAVASSVVVERMAVLAGNPHRCPHGEPIPTEDGVMPQVIDYLLTKVAVNQELVISRVTTHDAGKLDYLGTLGLKPGVALTLKDRAPFNGPLQLAVNGSTQVIGYELAGALRVCTQAEYDLV